MAVGPLRVAVVGAGYFAQFHYDAWRRIGEAELIALASPEALSRDDTTNLWLFAPGRPDTTPYGPVYLAADTADRSGQAIGS